MKKQRLDQFLAESGRSDSREQAKRLILAGEVSVDGVRAAKPGMAVSGEEEIAIAAKPRYVGRGGLKLEGALAEFGGLKGPGDFELGVDGDVGDPCLVESQLTEAGVGVGGEGLE